MKCNTEKHGNRDKMLYKKNSGPYKNGINDSTFKISYWLMFVIIDSVAQSATMKSR